MTATLQDVLNRLTAMGCKPTQSGAGYTSHCPHHEADGRSHTPSLTICAGDSQDVVLNCHAGCTYADIMNDLGLKPEPLNGKRKIIATYAYQDADGKLISEKIRYEPKAFQQCWPNESGGRVWKKPKDAPAVLYRLPELLEGIAAGETIYLVEGEKDADTLRDLDLVATTTIEGASKDTQKPKWRKEYTTQLTGAARVILIPDNDEPGRAHMAHIATQLQGNVRILELPGLSGAKGDNDVSDWLNKGHKLNELLAMVEQATATPSIWIRGSTLLKKQFADPAWILPDMLPDIGLYLLSAKPKTGKSWLALALAMAVAQCGFFLGRNVAGGRVLYLALEDNQRRIKDRMMRLQPDVAGHPEQLAESIFATEFPRLGAGAEQELERVLAKGGVRLIVVDTLQKIRPVGGGSNQYEADYLAISALKRLADLYSVCVLVVHHTRKMEADDVHDSVSGTLGLTGAADGSLVLVRQRGDGAAVLAVTGRDMPDNEFGLRFDGGLWTFAGSAEEVRASAEQNEVMTALRPCGSDGATTKELAKEIGKNQQTLRFLLRKLVDKQLVRVRNTKPPRYAVCDGVSGDERESSEESEKTTNAANVANATNAANATNGTQNMGSVSSVSLESDPPLTVQPPISVDSEKGLENSVSTVSGVSGVSAKPDLTQSPTAKRIIACLAGHPGGLTEEVLIATVSGKAGAALTQATINALLLAGKIGPTNGRLVGVAP